MFLATDINTLMILSSAAMQIKTNQVAERPCQAFFYYFYYIFLFDVRK